MTPLLVLRVIQPERTGSPAPFGAGSSEAVFLVPFVYSEHLQNREQEEVLMHEVLVGFAVVLGVSALGAALGLLAEAVARRRQGKG